MCTKDSPNVRRAPFPMNTGDRAPNSELDQLRSFSAASRDISWVLTRAHTCLESTARVPLGSTNHRVPNSVPSAEGTKLWDI
jgi:hypothetical protein